MDQWTVHVPIGFHVSLSRISRDDIDDVSSQLSDDDHTVKDHEN